MRLILFALAAWSFWSATSAIRTHVEFGGIEGKIDRIASRFGSQDLLVVESRNASDVHVIALPLAYIWGKPALVLNTPKPDPLLFAEFIRWARQRYQTVYFLGGGGTDLLSRDVSVEPVGSERFQVPEYESLMNAYPTHVRRKEFDFGIYRFVDPLPLPDGIAFDVGTMDDLQVVRFNAKERDRRGTFRWTRGQSYLSLLGVDETRRELVLWMNNGNRPPAARTGHPRGVLRRDVTGQGHGRPGRPGLRLRHSPAARRAGGEEHRRSHGSADQLHVQPSSAHGGRR